MSVLVLSRQEIHELLPIGKCIDVMQEAFTTLARGDAVQPLRSLVRLAGKRGILGMMPGQLGSPDIIGIKVEKLRLIVHRQNE